MRDGKFQITFPLLVHKDPSFRWTSSPAPPRGLGPARLCMSVPLLFTVLPVSLISHSLITPPAGQESWAAARLMLGVMCPQISRLLGSQVSVIGYKHCGVRNRNLAPHVLWQCWQCPGLNDSLCLSRAYPCRVPPALPEIHAHLGL